MSENTENTHLMRRQVLKLPLVTEALRTPSLARNAHSRAPSPSGSGEVTGPASPPAPGDRSPSDGESPGAASHAASGVGFRPERALLPRTRAARLGLRAWPGTRCPDANVARRRRMSRARWGSRFCGTPSAASERRAVNSKNVFKSDSRAKNTALAFHPLGGKASETAASTIANSVWKFQVGDKTMFWCGDNTQMYSTQVLG